MRNRADGMACSPPNRHSTRLDLDLRNTTRTLPTTGMADPVRPRRCSCQASARRCVRTSPAGAFAWVVSRASGARKASLSHSRAASSSRTVTSNPAPRNWAANASTRSRGAVSLATSIHENGLVWSMCPAAVWADSTRMVAATTCAAGSRSPVHSRSSARRSLWPMSGGSCGTTSCAHRRAHERPAHSRYRPDP